MQCITIIGKLGKCNRKHSQLTCIFEVYLSAKTKNMLTSKSIILFTFDKDLKIYFTTDISAISYSFVWVIKEHFKKSTECLKTGQCRGERTLFKYKSRLMYTYETEAILSKPEMQPIHKLYSF